MKFNNGPISFFTVLYIIAYYNLVSYDVLYLQLFTMKTTICLFLLSDLLQPPIPSLINFWPQMGNELDQNTGVSRLIYKMITRICLHPYNNLKEFERICGNWKSFKNDEKWFLFHLKSTFCFWDISIFVLKFWPCRKTVWWKS